MPTVAQCATENQVTETRTTENQPMEEEPTEYRPTNTEIPTIQPSTCLAGQSFHNPLHSIVRICCSDK